MPITLAIVFADFLKNQQPYLNKTEVLDLKQQGFDFGAHSANHPEYQYIPLEEQLWQTIESLNYLKKEIGVELLSFSFPFTDFGVTKEFFYDIEPRKACSSYFWLRRNERRQCFKSLSANCF